MTQELVTKTKDELVINKQQDDSFLSPGRFEHYFRMARMICQSALVPKSYQGKPEDVLVAMEMGRSLNLSPLSAVQNIAVINGKPTLYGDGVLAVCSGHPEFEDISEQQIIKNNQLAGYKCSVKRKGRTEVVKTFTIEDAKMAGLWDKSGPWKQYPERMLQMRARGFALRDSFADALGGVRFAEEVQDYEVKDVTPKKSVKQDLKSLIDNNKATVIEEVADIKASSEPVNIDQLIMIRDALTENKIDTKKCEAILQKFNVSHVEQLLSENVEDFIAQLIE